MYVPAFMCYKENFNLLCISFLYECMYPVQLKCCNTREILEYHVQCKMNAKLQMQCKCIKPTKEVCLGQNILIN